MKLSLFPTEHRGLALLLNVSSDVRECISALSQSLGAATEERVQLALDCERAENRSTDHHHALLTHLRSSYVSPIPREDLYQFSLYLHDATSHLAGAAKALSHMPIDRLPRVVSDQLEVLDRQSELFADIIRRLDNLGQLELKWLDMLRLSKRMSRAHQVWLTELSSYQRVGSYARDLAFADQLHDAMLCFRAIADHLGLILVRES